MYRIIEAEKVHISTIVAALNRRRHDFAFYSKHKSTMEEVEASLSAWWCVLGDNNLPTAFFKIINYSPVNRTITYTVIIATDGDIKSLIKDIVRHMFNRWNLLKVTTDIIYDRSDLIKTYISIGGAIEVRKRQHLYLAGKYVHVVEMAVLDHEFQY